MNVEEGATGAASRIDALKDFAAEKDLVAGDMDPGDAVATPRAHPVVPVLMGVSGCGKSTVAVILASRLGWTFEEGDALHPQANIEKMKAGHPLTDDDRWPWLDKVAEWVEERLDAGENGLITCSALKRSYRDVINRRGWGVEFVYLVGSKKVIAARLATRRGHYMPARLLDSQIAYVLRALALEATGNLERTLFAVEAIAV